MLPIIILVYIKFNGNSNNFSSFFFGTDASLWIKSFCYCRILQFDHNIFNKFFKENPSVNNNLTEKPKKKVKKVKKVKKLKKITKIKNKKDLEL